MKKYLYLAAFCLLLGPTVSAQNDADKGIEFPHRVVTNGFWDNWFVGVGAGVNVYGGQHDQHMSLGKRFAPAVNAYVGKWFTPGLGVRANYSGLYWNGVAISPETGFVRKGLGDGYHKQKRNFVNMHADVMLNLSEMFCGHNPQRAYSFIPYAGAGIIHSTSQPKNDELTWHAGIINRFRITDRLAVNVELATAFFKDKFDGELSHKRAEGMYSALVGMSYRIGKKNFDRNIIKYTGIDQSELDNANERANNLRAENEKLKEEIRKEKEMKAEPAVQVITTKTMAPVYVLFDLGKSALSKAQRINLQYAAASIKSCTDQVFTIEAYADNKTGSAETNKRLSSQRAETVKKCLVEEFGVPATMLRVDVKGGVDNMFYNDPALSRAVIIK